MQIELYTSNGCIKCIYLKSKLNEINIQYKEIDIFNHKESFEELDRLGLLRLPIVKIGVDKYLERPTIEEIKRTLHID